MSGTGASAAQSEPRMRYGSEPGTWLHRVERSKSDAESVGVTIRAAARVDAMSPRLRACQ